MMEFTKHEVQTLILAVGVAIDKERVALDRLRAEVPALGIHEIIKQRTALVNELDRLRGKLARG